MNTYEPHVLLPDGTAESLFPIEDDLAPAPRDKSRRSRIKESRAKRNRRKFYDVLPKVGLRARRSGVRHNSPKARNHNGK